MTTKTRLQLTLAIIKPDAVAQPHVIKYIKNLILSNNFLFVRSNMVRWRRSDAEQFYKEHEGRFFHNRLVTFMSSTHILAREDAISCWRKLMGPTKVFRTQYEDPDSIRGQFGLSDTRNCTHGSDSEESAAKEIHFFFPDFDIEKWYSEEELLFRQRKVTFDPKRDIHILDNTSPTRKEEPKITAS
ncbi:nucleoside diphosphate kinase 6 [Lingula anatina]|uniref:Nucleoside diphosphate kinase n=1 Tax=Lingula anatina TaxID=7574 RepID=A0A1S3JVJ4_LINAN|nr:nucleoside diphosphate kinase 6 [Lingula anatina]|eukprot:XP_013414312.1 nucleoside diphosphate kinase 6 [Lingula anatina]